MDFNTLLQMLIQYSAFLLACIAGIAILVSIVTELTKNTKYLDKIPTELEVIILSIGFALLGFFMYTSYAKVEVYWYYVTFVIFIGIIAAYVSMFGWEKLIKIKDKFSVPKEIRDVYKLTYSEKQALSDVLNTDNVNNTHEKKDTDTE